MSLPGVLGAIQGAWRKADRAAGGWLPGGGVASPVTRAIQSAVPSVPEAAKVIRDRVAVPVLDKGIETGVLPAKEAMFARYLTGTSKPLTVYPEREREEIAKASDQIAIGQTRDQVDAIYKQENPVYRQFSDTSSEFSRLQRGLRDRAEAGGVVASQTETAAMADLSQRKEELRRRLNLTDSDVVTGSVKLSDKERLEIIRRHGLQSAGEAVVGYDTAYGGALPREVELSLGSFKIRDGEIRDRYQFDNLQDGRTYRVPGEGNVYPDAAGGGRLASDLIELGLKSGVITPRSGYDVRVPLKPR